MTASSTTAREPAASFVAYLLLLAVSAGVFLAVQNAGQGLTANPAAEIAQELKPVSSHKLDVIRHVLITLVAIVALGNLLAWLFQYLGQPAVIGEVVAGILLGPSFLGAISPDAMHCLIPSVVDDPHGQVLASLKTVAQLGVVLYMFIVGLELNPGKVGVQAKAAVAISHASILIPFNLGAILALWLYPIVSTSAVPFTSFALFLGVAMSITAFPVLARILTDRKLERTDLGVLALSCAATDDVTAWCLLAFVVGVTQAQISSAILVAILTLVYLVVMFFVVRPLAVKWVAHTEKRGLHRQATPLLLVLVLLSALATEAIGIHAVFGAFLLGAVIPHDSLVARELSRKLHDVVTILLLPAFFAVTGMNTQIGLMTDLSSWVVCAVIIIVATLGKWGGTVLAARFVGIEWRSANALGVLMNTRGLMELIVLNIGLALGVISPKLFAMMVLMAVATTVATAPILRRIVPATATH